MSMSQMFVLQETSVVVLNQKLSPDSDVAVMVCMQTLAVLGVERNSYSAFTTGFNCLHYAAGTLELVLNRMVNCNCIMMST